MTQNTRIEIVPYDPSWPNMYEAEAATIKMELGDNCIAIYHVGSTSVPELSAKPKIDIVAVVQNLLFPESQLSALGYIYRGGFSIPLRRSFTLRTSERNVNLHVFEENDPEIELNIIFRDYLRKNTQARLDYEALKYHLIAQDSSHEKNDALYKGYTLGKHDFIQNILNQAGFKRHRFVLCTHYSEWEAAKHLRQKYFFGSNSDPYVWTFNHPEHKHVVFYLGIEIIGYAHIQLWPDARAAIRIIAIDETKRNNNFGSTFLNLCEKWLRNECYKSIHAESRPTSLAFYRKNGYVDMAYNDPEGYEGGEEDIPVGKIL